MSSVLGWGLNAKTAKIAKTQPKGGGSPGFGLYGAFKKFAARGVAVVVVTLILGVWMFGDFLLSF